MECACRTIAEAIAEASTGNNGALDAAGAIGRGRRGGLAEERAEDRNDEERASRATAKQSALKRRR